MKQIKQSELLAEVGKIISSDLNLNTILNIIIKTVDIGLKSEVASLMLLDEEAGELKIETSYGLPYEIARNVRLKLDGESISCWVARTGDPVLLSGKVQDDRFKGANAKIKSAISVPLKIGDEIIGVINVSNVGENVSFVEKDLDLLVSIANQSAALVKSLKLQKLLYARTQKLEVLEQISGMINSLFNSHELLRNITAAAVELLVAKGGFSFLESEGKITLSTEYISKSGPTEVSTDNFLKVAARVTEQGACACFSYDSKDEEIKELFSKSRMSSILCCPFKSKTDTLGSLLVFREFPESKFTKDEVSFFETISRITGIALSNAILYENLLKKHQELERAQQGLILQERIVSLAELSGGIAHELKNPITVILGFAELVELGVEEPKQAIKKIEEHAFRASRIIEGLKRLSQNKPPEPKPIDLNSIIDASLALLHYRFTKEKVELKKSFYEPLLTILADEVQLQQIFMNLINNGMDALQEKKVITVEARLVGERAVVIIKD
ncbi:MAG: GAF domain-containing protein, partial [Candidatus Omnitrophica bacterium]|nr:GAF domain-containing protein [Candidatus Omnitrophota bacterium]